VKTKAPRPELVTKKRPIDADAELLDKLIEHPAMAFSSNLQRFVDMRAKLKQFIGLTDRQRAWVQHEAAAIGIDVPKTDHPGARPKASAWDPDIGKTPKSTRAKVRRAVKALGKGKRGGA
jgi:hypothetical protein